MTDFEYGHGWMSDESSFYGDESTRNKMESKAKRKLELRHQYPVKRQSPKPTIDVLSFLKSRPQIGEMDKCAAKEPKPIRKIAHTVAEEKNVTLSAGEEQASSATGREAADFLNDNRFEGNPAAWQRSETVNAFLERAPVMDPESAELGYWLWVQNPKPIKNHLKHENKADIKAFKEHGQQLLETFSAGRAKVERLNPDAAPATVTRKLGRQRGQLEEDLLMLAIKTSTTCGKWMLFPTSEDYARSWRLVAEATAAGKLGLISKAATPCASAPLNLICVYTYDFSDEGDVRRVLDGLVELSLCQSDGKPIFYKCDAYTYLGIQSNNKYKLKASRYSSKDFLVESSKAKSEVQHGRSKTKSHHR